MKIKFTEEELIRIVEAAHILSWDMDLYEIVDFIDKLYDKCKIEIPSDIHYYIGDQNEDYSDARSYEEWKASVSEEGK